MRRFVMIRFGLLLALAAPAGAGDWSGKGVWHLRAVRAGAYNSFCGAAEFYPRFRAGAYFRAGRRVGGKLADVVLGRNFDYTHRPDQSSASALSDQGPTRS